MDAKDQQKIARAGFTILRRYDYPTPHIKYKSKANPSSWYKMNIEFKSKAARDRYVKELQHQINIIEE